MHSSVYYYSDLEKLFGLDRRTVWRMVRKGSFPANVNLTPGRTCFRRTDVDAWFSALPPVPHAGADE